MFFHCLTLTKTNKLENDDRGLWHGAIIDAFLIDFYIPFLPLEKIHVKKCIRDQLRGEVASSLQNADQYMRDHLEADVDYVADQMIYEPPGLHKFSTAGCKRVVNLVRNVMALRLRQSKADL